MARSPEVEHLEKAILATRKALQVRPTPHPEVESEADATDEASESPLQRVQETAQRLRDAQ